VVTDDQGNFSAVAEFMMTDDCRVGHVSTVVLMIVVINPWSFFTWICALSSHLLYFPNWPGDSQNAPGHLWVILRPGLGSHGISLLGRHVPWLIEDIPDSSGGPGVLQSWEI
jgi:hypothetical protein